MAFLIPWQKEHETSEMEDSICDLTEGKKLMMKSLRVHSIKDHVTVDNNLNKHYTVRSKQQLCCGIERHC